MRYDGVLLVKLVESVVMPVFLMLMIWRASIEDFKQFIDAMHSPGASIVVGYALLITGIIMMKIMLYDDGKYVVGAGVGILAKSLNGTTNATGEPASHISSEIDNTIPNPTKGDPIP